ncbi:fumarylacetoacetate hydrolase family protein [Azohydromonas lata]|uniref:Fumarylacetoacetate hydrolase family protein n=1 Tax=Azohydromonas lata TaxID=45677 RepID=A0ABU5IR28_9BURK|nr:fumarylacetoacetate hydrolase family protein [Azohydromonas lata]MDZ5461334.1 fumarylacetoacetate hydrolase family protein [Azohydromonas lata]
MKLATYKDGSRDGQLVVVSRDLTRAHFATGIATRLQQVLDDWNYMAPQLQQLYEALNRGQVRHAFDFDPRLCAAPLPRAFQLAWATRPSPVRPEAEPDAPAPLRLELCAGDALLGPRDVAEFASDGWDLDAEAGIAVVTGDIAAGTPALEALEGVRLLTLMSRWRLRALDASDAGFSPPPALGPVAVTPDELGTAWEAGRLRADLQLTWNQRRLARCNAAEALPWHFGQALARLAHTRMLQAGSVVGCAAQAEVAGASFSVQTLRAHEPASGDAPTGGWLRHGDRLRLELLDARGQAPLGAIEQAVAISRG